MGFFDFFRMDNAGVDTLRQLMKKLYNFVNQPGAIVYKKKQTLKNYDTIRNAIFKAHSMLSDENINLQQALTIYEDFRNTLQKADYVFAFKEIFMYCHKSPHDYNYFMTINNKMDSWYHEWESHKK